MSTATSVPATTPLSAQQRGRLNEEILDDILDDLKKVGRMRIKDYFAATQIDHEAENLALSLHGEKKIVDFFALVTSERGDKRKELEQDFDRLARIRKYPMNWIKALRQVWELKKGEGF